MDTEVIIFIGAANGSKLTNPGQGIRSFVLNDLMVIKSYRASNKTFLWRRDVFSSKSLDLLLDHVTQRDPNYPHEDDLFEIIEEHLTMDINLAVKLNRQDVIGPKALCYKSELGKAMIEFLDHQEYKFVVDKKYWESGSKLFIDFQATHEDFVYETIKHIQKGVYI